MVSYAYAYGRPVPSIQLLPKVDEARLIRLALNELMSSRDSLTEEQQDMAWKIISDISTKLRSQRL